MFSMDEEKNPLMVNALQYAQGWIMQHRISVQRYLVPWVIRIPFKYKQQKLKCELNVYQSIKLLLKE